MASFNNHQERRNILLLKAAEKGDINFVRQWLDEGAEIDYFRTGFWGDKTPLICAARHGRTDVARLLLERGAAADFQDSGLTTALMWAARNGHVGVVNALLAAGADPSLQDTDGWTAARFAKENGRYNIVNILELAEQSGPRSRSKPGVVPASTPDEVVFERPLGNRLLQEIFNFKSLERISLIRKDADSDIEAITREPFAAIEDQPSLREAFEEHIKRGGKADESAVFPNKLLKNKLPKQG